MSFDFIRHFRFFFSVATELRLFYGYETYFALVSTSVVISFFWDSQVSPNAFSETFDYDVALPKEDCTKFSFNVSR